MTLSATVTDPDGQPLAGADVTFTLSMPGIPTVTIDGKTDANGKASFKTTIPKGADRRPGQRHRPGHERGRSARPRTSRSSRSPSSVGPPARDRPRQRRAIAATIRACRCGAVRIAGHPRPRRPGAGSAIDPARRAPPVGTSVGRSRPSSATAGSTASARRSGATRSAPAGRPSAPRRRVRQRRRAPVRRSSRRRSRRSNPCSDASSSWRSARRRSRPAQPRPPRVGRGGPSAPLRRSPAPTIRPRVSPSPGVPAASAMPAWSLWGDAET